MVAVWAVPVEVSFANKRVDFAFGEIAESAWPEAMLPSTAAPPVLASSATYNVVFPAAVVTIAFSPLPTTPLFRLAEAVEVDATDNTPANNAVDVISAKRFLIVIFDIFSFR
jgi:hypothetical protein